MKKVIFSVIFSTLLLVFVNVSAQETKIKEKDDKVKIKADDGKKEGKIKADKMKHEDMMGKDDMMEKGHMMGKMEMEDTRGFPYKADYSSQFAIGSQANAKKILELWKDYDANMLNTHADYFSDTVTVDLPNGTRLTGKDAVMKAIGEYRTSQGKVESTVDAWISTKSLDRNEDWVSIWGVETATDATGKVTKNRIHEIWQLNKDGKVVYMAQFVATPPAM
jgi:hypothetical protein